VNEVSDHPNRSNPEQLPADMLWKSLVSEPHTGVCIITIDGLVLYMNVQSSRMFFGSKSRPSDCIGKRLEELHPPEWVSQRLATFDRVSRTGKPALLRSIVQGRQLHSWIQPIEADGMDNLDPDDRPARETPQRFLTISRYVEGDDPLPPTPGKDYDYVESEFVDLGPLDVLSPRELEVLALIGQGMSNKEIAATLFRSVKTIDNHRAAIGQKLKVDDRVTLGEIAHRAGLTLKDAERERT